MPGSKVFKKIYKVYKKESKSKKVTKVSKKGGAALCWDMNCWVQIFHGIRHLHIIGEINFL